MIRIIASAFVLLTGILGLSLPSTVRAAQSYDNCTGFVTSLPAVISTQGTWCFKQDLTTAMTSGSAISINANNVILDCNDFRMQATSPTSAFGIYSDSHLNITVRRCDVRAFQDGVHFSGSSGGNHVIEDNRFDGIVNNGINVTGDGSVVRRNWVFNTGGNGGNPIGIVTYDSVDILDNTVALVSPGFDSPTAATGILSNGNVANSISGNHVRGVAGGGASPIDYGILPDGSATLRNNEVIGRGGANSFGIACHYDTSHAKDNVINGFNQAISTCSDDGGNVSAP